MQGEFVRLMADLDYLWGADCGGWDEILPGLLRSARTSPEIRRSAALLLGRRGRLGFLLIPVIRLLTEPDAVIRQNALEDIGHMTRNYEFFADELAALAAHPEMEVRRAVAQAYRQLGKSPPTTLVAERLSAPFRAAERPERAAHPPVSESEALRVWARLVQLATAPGNELRVLDDFFVLTGSPAAEARREAATRWLRRVPPTERARLRAHFYLWSAGQWKVPD